ncbi:MAG: hypothetical protein AAFV46_00895 [Cyanobacteria bacterium J06635_11]
MKQQREVSDMWLVKGIFNTSLVLMIFGAGYWARGKTQPIHTVMERIEQHQTQAASLMPW